MVKYRGGTLIQVDPIVKEWLKNLEKERKIGDIIIKELTGGKDENRILVATDKIAYIQKEWNNLQKSITHVAEVE